MGDPDVESGPTTFQDLIMRPAYSRDLSGLLGGITITIDGPVILIIVIVLLALTAS